jgi:hypothetical protein
VRLHHAEGLLDPQVERTPHTSGDMAAQGTEAPRHGAPGLTRPLLDALARFESRFLRSLQFLLGGVVGGLERLCLCR